MTTETWPTSTLMAVTGTTERMLGYWRDHDWITYTQAEPGPGYPIRWSFDDMLRVALVHEIIGGKTGHANRIAERVREVPLQADYVMLAPYVSAIAPQDVLTLLRRHTAVTVVHLDALRYRLALQLSSAA